MKFFKGFALRCGVLLASGSDEKREFMGIAETDSIKWTVEELKKIMPLLYAPANWDMTK